MTPEPAPKPYTPRRRSGRQRQTEGAYACGRCHRNVAGLKAWWPDAAVCYVCFVEAANTYGECPDCSQHRLLPGRSLTTGQPICRDCSGITTPLVCNTCGKEGQRVRAGECASCALRTTLTGYLQPDQRPQAQALIDALTQVSRPLSLIHWLNKNKTSVAILTGLGDGSIAYSHDAFDELPAGGSREHLRALLIQHELLPPRDRFLPAFHTWLDDKLRSVDGQNHHSILRRFAQWTTVRTAHARIELGQSTEGVLLTGKQNVTVAIQLLNWLSTRQLQLATLQQLDLDRWITTGPSTRKRIQPFLRWAATAREAPPLTVPRSRMTIAPLAEEQRLSWIRRCLHDDTVPLRARVAAMLVLVYAQPIGRIVELRTSDLETHDGQRFIRFGSARCPLPDPFAALVDQHLPTRRRRTQTGPDTIWLFPGQRPGDHISANSMRVQLHRNGLAIFKARNAALQDLVRHTPPAIVARTLGFSSGAMQRQADAAAVNYQRYAPQLRTRQAIHS